MPSGPASGPSRVTPPPPPTSRASSPSTPASSSATPDGIPSWATPDGDPAATADTADAIAPGEQGVLDLLQRAFGLYKRHWKIMLSVAAVVFLPGALLHALARAAILAPTVAVNIMLDPATHMPLSAPIAVGTVMGGFAAIMLGLLAAAVTGLFFHGVVMPLTQAALALAAADRLAGGTATWDAVWRQLLRRVGVLASALIPAALLVGAGFFFLVVPGVLLAFFFSFVPAIALFEGKGGTAALRRSYELARADWLRLLLVLLAFGIITGVAQFLAGVIFGGLFGARLLQDLLTLIALPIPVIGSLLLYFDIRRKQEGWTPEQLASELADIRG